MAEEIDNAANDLITFDWGATEDNDFFQMEETKPAPK